MKATCPRLFEVEAQRDGRLSGAELSHFRDHLAVCTVCAREAETLAGLATRLREAEGPLVADELHIRRERTRLLAAFDRGLVPAPSQQTKLLQIGASMAAVVLLAALVYVFWPTSSVAPLAQSSDPVLIRADSSARWSRQTVGGFDRVRLEQGALSIRVRRATPQPRLLVELPDGELEDIGTTFSVSVDAGRTTSVSVQEGSVVLRLAGEAPRVLGAGDAWSQNLKQDGETLPAPALSVTALSSSPRPALATPSFVRRGVSLAPATTASLEPAAVIPDTAADFRAAMAAFNRGAHQQAAALFATFLAQYPGDARAEDAMYLRVLSLQRSGNTSATDRAARDYLKLYPGGFRRAEVEALTRP